MTLARPPPKRNPERDKRDAGDGRSQDLGHVATSLYRELLKAGCVVEAALERKTWDFPEDYLRRREDRGANQMSTDSRAAGVRQAQVDVRSLA